MSFSGGRAQDRRTGPGQALIDLALGMALDDPRDDIGDVGLRIDGVELRGLDQERSSRSLGSPGRFRRAGRGLTVAAAPNLHFVQRDA